MVFTPLRKRHVSTTTSNQPGPSRRRVVGIHSNEEFLKLLRDMSSLLEIYLSSTYVLVNPEMSFQTNHGTAPPH